MNTVHHKNFRNFFFIKLNKNKIKSNKIRQNFRKIKFSKMKIFKNEIFENKIFVENNILNAKLIALHYLQMQGQCVYTDLCV